MTTVVLVEDDSRIRSRIVRMLAERGYETRATSNGLEGLTLIVDEKPDAVLLDLGLPDISGLDLLRMLRAVSDVPVIVVTARDDDDEIVRTLDLGADDYIVKPFSVNQLEARVRAVLRRTRDEESGEQPLVVGGLRVDTASRTATLDGKPLDLSRKEFDLLAVLARRAGRVVTRRQLLAEVWGQPFGGSDKTVDVHLSWLRKKMDESASQPRYLLTVHGVGIRLVDPSAEAGR